MANTICIMGEPGSGKTYSLRNLDPKSTLIMDCDGKGLAWRGWKTDFNEEAKNYTRKNRKGEFLNKLNVLSTLRKATEIMPGVKVVVIDTLNAIMLADERARKDEKGYDKWADLAWSVYDILDYALKMPDDMTVIFVAHSQTEREDDGFRLTRVKTSGRKLDKIMIESKVRTVLNAKRVDGEYILETRSDRSTAKDGMGGELDERLINDIVPVIEALHDFDEGGAPDAQQA